MQTRKNHAPRAPAVRLFIPYVYALVAFFFGFTDLPRMREEAFPLSGFFILMLAIPVLLDFRRTRAADCPTPSAK